MKAMAFVFLISLLSVFGCSKSTSPGNTIITPTNLTVVADVSSDSSGNVSFTATATDASTYDFDFGNGVYQTVPSGKVTYKYPASGNYTVNVVAKSVTSNAVSKSV